MRRRNEDEYRPHRHSRPGFRARIHPGVRCPTKPGGRRRGRATRTRPERVTLACNIAALTPKEKQRHFDELGPQLRSLKKGVRELADGYEFEFPSDRATYRLLTEWADGERICCPFFDIELRSEREGGPVFLRLTGRDNVEKFIEVDGAAWLEK